jgi:hypothetical protein
MGRTCRGAALLAAASLVACAPEGQPSAVPQGFEPTHVLHTLPAWAPMGGITVGRQVFLKSSQQNAIGIGHELVHVRQQAQSPLWFWVSYATSPRWRLRWEAEAYAVQARAGCPIDGDDGLAAYLSGPAYLWTSTPAEAAREIGAFR